MRIYPLWAYSVRRYRADISAMGPKELIPYMCEITAIIILLCVSKDYVYLV